MVVVVCRPNEDVPEPIEGKELFSFFYEVAEDLVREQSRPLDKNLV